MYPGGASADADNRDLSYLHCPFLNPLVFVQVRGWLAWTPPKLAAPPMPRRVRAAALNTRDQAALDEWEHRYGIAELERDAWLAAGLSMFEPHLAAQCFRAGLSVGSLSRTVDGRRVVWWLRSGESADSVRARLLSASA